MPGRAGIGLSLLRRNSAAFLARRPTLAYRARNQSAPLPPPSPHRSLNVLGTPLPRRTVLSSFVFGLALLFGLPRSAEAAPLVGRPRGRPRIKLDRVTLPRDTAYADEILRHLKFVLRRAARRADWGTGASSTISLRFTVETLKLSEHSGALHVRCSALGELPRRRTARSQLTYGGDPKLGTKLVKQVLEIVARGVISRLAEMERHRRRE